MVPLVIKKLRDVRMRTVQLRGLPERLSKTLICFGVFRLRFRCILCIVNSRACRMPQQTHNQWSCIE